ncbi:hypothetical protein [Streptomyces sp. NPDC005907]
MWTKRAARLGGFQCSPDLDARVVDSLPGRLGETPVPGGAVPDGRRTAF